MMGGKIHAQSTLGKGSTFSLVVTLGRAADEDAESAASEGPASARMQGPAVRPLRVLVVEDSSMLQLLVRVVLGKRGHAVTVAGDGLTALQVLARERFDLVLMDVQMPNMDGFAATLAIRSLPDPHARLVPIVAMTAHAMAEHRRQCLAGGMDDYLAKPIRSRDLIAVVERLGARQDRLEVIAP
jgi:CheY-like chemotaxis protein